MSRSLPDPRRVAVAQLAFIGDMVFATPLLDAIRARWKDAVVAVIGRPTALGVLADHPSVDERIAYDKDGPDRGPAGLWRIAARVRAFAPDLFLGVSRSGRTALLARASGAPLRAGFAGPAGALAYTHRTVRRDARRFPERPLALLELLGVAPAPRPLRLAVGAARRERAGAALREAGWRGEPLLAIAPGSNYATKRWPEAHVARLLDLALAHGGLRPALYGGPAEAALIGRLLAGRPGILDRRTAGIEGLTAEAALARVFLAGDSGPAHIARALGTATVVLHGPTDPAPLADGAPYTVLTLGLECQPCSPHGDAVCPLRHHRCMEDLEPERVFGAVLAAARL